MQSAWGEGTSKSSIRRKNRGERIDRERRVAQSENIRKRGDLLANVALTVRQIEYLASLLEDDDHDNAIRAGLMLALPNGARR